MLNSNDNNTRMRKRQSLTHKKGSTLIMSFSDLNFSFCLIGIVAPFFRDSHILVTNGLAHFFLAFWAEVYCQTDTQAIRREGKSIYAHLNISIVEDTTKLCLIL